MCYEGERGDSPWGGGIDELTPSEEVGDSFWGVSASGHRVQDGGGGGGDQGVSRNLIS